MVQTIYITQMAFLCIAELGETPYSQSRAHTKSYLREKVKKIIEAMQRMVIPGEPINEGTEMVQRLKKNFSQQLKEMNSFKY